MKFGLKRPEKKIVTADIDEEVRAEKDLERWDLGENDDEIDESFLFDALLEEKAIKERE